MKLSQGFVATLSLDFDEHSHVMGLGGQDGLLAASVRNLRAAMAGTHSSST
jgi:hypothetical protein